MTNDLILAYLAGVVDSDGCISVYAHRRLMRDGSRGKATYAERIYAKQVTPQAIDLLHETFGGTKRMIPGKNGNRAMFYWQAVSLRAHAALWRMERELILKAMA